MNRLSANFENARARGTKLLLPFLTGYYPDRDTFLRLLFEMERAGADGVEVGIPFSDPSADGPTIQTTSQRALAQGATVKKILAAVAEARAGGLKLPLLYMTYYNPVYAFGPGLFAVAARDSGADGVLVVDLPPEEDGEFRPHAEEAGLAFIRLVAPTTPEARIPLVVSGVSGFVYCVSVTGVTGVKKPVAELVGGLVDKVRRHTALPVLAGFGVTGPEAASSLAGVCDGVIVGSALMEAFGDKRGRDAVEAAGAFVRGLRAALGGDQP